MITNVRSLLLETASITALVRSRIFVDRVPQSEDSFPVICLQEMDHDTYDCLDGSSGFGDRLSKTSIQVEIAALSGGARQAVVAAVVNLLKDYVGPAGEILIRAVNKSPEVSNMFSPKEDGSDEGYFISLTRFDIFWE